jgi:diaminopimelate decarboxylase
VLEFIDGDAARSDGVTYYDCGGGYGSSGPFSDELFDFASLCEGLADLLPPRDLSLVCEPGRFLLGDAGVLLSEVVHVKEVATKRFVVVDAGMNDLIRPSLYRAEHEIRPVVSSGPALPVPTDVVGPICESTDFLGKGRELPAIERGELLAIFSAGAYGASMASNYNARPLPAEVLCGDGAPRCIRRRQTIEDLWRDEVDEPLGSAL